jgi:undecaprenyl diphosphate synthase
MSSNNIPKSIGFIMDGNRRWAKTKNLPSFEGHRAGYEALKECLKWCKEFGVTYAIFYAFSTENWKRSEEEVGYLMDLLRKAIKNELGSLREEKVRVKFIGDTKMLDEDIRKGVVQLEEDTRNYEGTTLVIALSYGGRREITDAVNKAIKEGVPLDEDKFSQLLYTKDIQDPDLIIRTGGERRLSNFLPWQSVYSELFFVNTLWPDFSKEEFSKILQEYSQIERRNGK